MSLITVDQLDLAVPPARYDDLDKYAAFLDVGMTRFEINTPARIAAFLAQVAHESGDFMRVEENLNYSWQGLRKTWPARFASDEFAQRYHRNPERIANLVYGGRFGNGEAVGDSLILENPALLAQPRHATLSACWFWTDRLENWSQARQVFLA